RAGARCRSPRAGTRWPSRRDQLPLTRRPARQADPAARVAAGPGTRFAADAAAGHRTAHATDRTQSAGARSRGRCEPAFAQRDVACRRTRFGDELSFRPLMLPAAAALLWLG